MFNFERLCSIEFNFTKVYICYNKICFLSITQLGSLNIEHKNAIEKSWIENEGSHNRASVR